MVHIKIEKGLDIPIKGKPSGSPRSIAASGSGSATLKPRFLALDLAPFEDIKFHLLAKLNDPIKRGEPIAEDKDAPGRMFVSPASGIIREIRRGLKRRLLSIVIEVDKEESLFDHGKLSPESATPDQLIEKLCRGGIFSRIFKRPFHLLANPKELPRSIFIKAIESAPFIPPADLQLLGHENEFQIGLTALAKLCPVHLVHAKEAQAFAAMKGATLHSAEGPHPISNPSLHIQRIDPILSADTTIWTLNVHDVISIGHLLSTGHTYTDRVISIAGPGVLPDQIGYYKISEGFPIESLIAGRVEKSAPLRFISGDPLMGTKVEADGFLGLFAFAFTVIPENTTREFLHFFRSGLDKYSFSRAYLSGHLDNTHREYNFTTNQHGEKRAFVDSSLYDKVQPLHIPTMQLVKAVMAEDFDLADELGLLEVESADFALPTFVCPCKMEMTEIIKSGLARHAKELLE